jgi:hypothetical protein
LRGYIISVQEKKHRWLLAILGSRQRNKFAYDAGSRSLVVDAKQEDGTDRLADVAMHLSSSGQAGDVPASMLPRQSVSAAANPM